VFTPLVRRLETLTNLTVDETDALLNLSGEVRRFGARQDVVRENDDADCVNVMLQGYACRYKQLKDGRRQITAYFVPGDPCDTSPILRPKRDYAVSTLSPAAIVAIPLDVLVALITAHPGIERALQWAGVAEGAITREWLVSLGQRTAFERLAHFLCEMFHRLQMVGLTDGNRCEFPITQTELADTLGLSTVHVNRTMQDLRREGLIALKGRILVVHDIAMLQQISVFDPNYLTPAASAVLQPADR
jgi:CRP-like cAMP-binding protein